MEKPTCLLALLNEGDFYLKVKISKTLNMGLGQIESMAKYNSSKTGSLNRASHSANSDIANAHVGCIMEDLELRPADERRRPEENQQCLSGTRAINCEGVKVSHYKRKGIYKVGIRLLYLMRNHINN